MALVKRVDLQFVGYDVCLIFVCACVYMVCCGCQMWYTYVWFMIGAMCSVQYIWCLRISSAMVKQHGQSS